MTLDGVEVDVSKVFEDGQCYVALSRAKTFEGLRVQGFSRAAVRANPKVLAFYRQFEGN